MRAKIKLFTLIFWMDALILTYLIKRHRGLFKNLTRDINMFVLFVHNNIFVYR